MAITSFQINGSALCYSALYVGGVRQSFNLLGYTDHGVRLRVIENKSDIITDVMGPMTPQDIQDMGMIANISVPLIASDRTQLSLLESLNDNGVAGQIGTPGLVLGANSAMFAVGITASTLAGQADSPWMFPYCVIRPGFDTTLATRANPFTLEFFSWPYSSFANTVGKGLTLWSRSFTPP